MNLRVKIRHRDPGPARTGHCGRRRRAPRPPAAALGTLLDYAAGVIPASQIRAAAAVGSIRYVSDRRPGGAWMLGKPIQVAEAHDLNSNGLKIVSNYQFGKGGSSDWLGGARRRPATRATRDAAACRRRRPGQRSDLRLDRRRPVLRAVQEPDSAVSAVLGICGRTPADGCLRQLEDDRLGTARRLGSYFWQHNWGSPKGYAHPAPICTRSRSISAASAGRGGCQRDPQAPIGQWA